MSRRRTDHLSALRGGRHTIAMMQQAWDIAGEADFDFRPLEDAEDHTALIEREQFWLDTFGADDCPLFNISPAAGTTAGIVKSDAEREAMRANPKRRFRGKLSAHAVAEIKRDAANGISYSVLAERFDVHRHTIYMIATGRYYPDLHAAASENVLA